MERDDILNIAPESFLTIDDYKDSFAKIQDVASERMYGDPMSAGEPWFSVVVPTYCRDALLRETLESVRAQQSADFSWETVVVDNTPLDESGMTPALRVVRELGDPTILYYHNCKNIGSGYNWNRGVELARGEWVVFLHDDDLLFPDALQNVGRQIRSYRGRKPLGYLHARRIEFSGRAYPDPDLGKRRHPAERLTRLGVLIGGNIGAGAPTCGTAILKQAYLETGGINYDFGPSADAVLCYQIMRDYAVILSDRVLGSYRWDDNASLSKESLLQMVRSDERLLAYVYGRSRFSRRWGGIFGAAASWRNIKTKMNIAQRHHLQIPYEAFCSATDHAEPGQIRKALFLGCYAAYRLWRLLDGKLR